MMSFVQIMLSAAGLFFCSNLLGCSQNAQPLCFDFDASMHRGFPPEIYPKMLQRKPQRQFLPIVKKLFSQNIAPLKRGYSSFHQKIPRIIHQIWLGSPLPERYKAFQESWIKLHPAWKYKLWTDSDIEAFELTNIDAYRKARNYAEKANIFRYEILERFGGLYVDTDFECLRAFDAVHDAYEFYAGLATVAQITLINNALIGAIPHHPILKACISNIHTNDPKLHQMSANGTIYFGKMILEFCIQKNITRIRNIIIFPPTYFYPWPGNRVHRWTKDNVAQNLIDYVTPESFAVHYWDSTWGNDH